ncbi:hypothetical protein GGR44_000871 [Sphingobium fontiphilum]|uniref:DUF1134 domain-containing protein n=1 Tax=Sphingobium fontiphilum TaxID=944425 RepID=A0A7W6DLH1_9SPHN|nr:DUF1134 domain-containing protein [Sphingobium fontiphilum]MBB3981224.1 hypothetical protein [Sphingobium fontiphilum]
MSGNAMQWVSRIGPAGMMIVALAAMAIAPARAQVRTIDPNSAIDADLAPPPPANAMPTEPGVSTDSSIYDSNADTGASAGSTATGAPVTANSPPSAPDAAISYQEDDLIGAAEGVFGKGAEGLAGLIEKVLKDQGRPNAYIAGREASGAFVVGLRYGSGTLNHKVEGKREVYWTGPSIGFDVGGNASNTFVLVYNLYDTQDLFHRFPAAEGTAYLVGGFTATYLRWGNVVLIPIRLGVGYRLGVNAGYMKFTEKRTWLPF